MRWLSSHTGTGVVLIAALLAFMAPLAVGWLRVTVDDRRRCVNRQRCRRWSS